MNELKKLRQMLDRTTGYYERLVEVTRQSGEAVIAKHKDGLDAARLVLRGLQQEVFETLQTVEAARLARIE